ncbi:hypothetical protein AK812_SmicGene4514 [Symbiodinium microadriaticum]|uniref:Transmembrane protein n=1 Tax=Symbiodinium microadriaticum TaxID=2951 RepID=A0A1Q9EW57_SYMMI|nr:hypothetical protein AK812_SmicGene4514 [Symbiodinium microadriaticum]
MARPSLRRRGQGGLLLALLLLSLRAWTFVAPQASTRPRRSPGHSGVAVLSTSAAQEEVKPSTEVKTPSEELEATEEEEAEVQKTEAEDSKAEIAEWRPLEAFYEPSQDTIFNSIVAVVASIFAGGSAILISQGLQADYFILVFFFVVIALGFLLALFGLKAISGEEEQAEKAEACEARSLHESALQPFRQIFKSLLSEASTSHRDPAQLWPPFVLFTVRMWSGGMHLNARPLCHGCSSKDDSTPRVWKRTAL